MSLKRSTPGAITHDSQPQSALRGDECYQPERPSRIDIMALPSEILAEILLLAADWHQPKPKMDPNADISADYSSFCRNVVRFSHVCCAWRTMMLDTPHFWVIGPPNTLQGLKTFIERSKSIPLRLHLLYTTKYATIGYLHQVFRNAHRAHAVHISIDIPLNDDEPHTSEWLTWSMENASFPLLEQLNISSRSQTFSVPDPRCISDWSNLRELTIENCELAWPMPKLLNNLTKLSYTVPRYMSDKISSKTVEIFQGLAHSPLLEWLELSNPRDHMWEPETNEETTRSYPLVHLPNLKYVSLRRFTYRRFIAFTNQVRLSEDASIRVDIHVSRNPEPPLLLSVFERLMQLAVLHRRTVDNWMIDFKHIANVRGYCSLPSTSPEEQHKCVVHMDIGHTSSWHSPYPSQVQADLLRGLCSPVMTALSLHCISDWTISQWQQILNVCSQLQAISLDGNVFGLFSFLTALSLRSLDSRSCRYLCRLQHLRLLGLDLCGSLSQHTQEHPNLRSLLVQVLQLRKESRISIDLLWLECTKECKEDDVAELRQLVGKLKWAITNPGDVCDRDSLFFWYV